MEVRVSRESLSVKSDRLLYQATIAGWSRELGAHWIWSSYEFSEDRGLIGESSIIGSDDLISRVMLLQLDPDSIDRILESIRSVHSRILRLDMD